MCFIFTCGETEFSNYLQGYENITCQCHNCGNFSAHVIKRRPFFTFCFIPVIPLSIHGYEDIVCNVCKFAQPLQNRQDVVQMQGTQGHQMQPQGPHQGWSGAGAGGGNNALPVYASGGAAGTGSIQPKPQQSMQYG